MKIYKVSMQGYTSIISATDKQHARSKFASRTLKHHPIFPIAENLGSISAVEINTYKWR